MKVVMACGGTAGHINPALSIASILKKNIGNCEIEFVGTKDRLESTLVPKAGYPIHFIEIYGLKRSLSLKNIKTAWKTITSVAACKKLLRQIKPDLVVGIGGYVCFPVCYAAASLHIPVALHEANAEPGFAVKMLKNRADLIFVNFEDAGKFLKSSKCRVIHSGMPIDCRFDGIDRRSAREKVRLSDAEKISVLSFGGSLGAAHINNAILGFMKSYMPDHPDVSLTHASGGKSYAEMKKLFDEAGLGKYPNISLVDYIYDMPVRMVAADLVICRSGASTLSELAATSKPSILIPSPNVTNNQQYKNAKLLADMGAAVLIDDDKLTPDLLAEAVDGLISDRDKLTGMQTAAGRFAVKDTESIIFENLMSIVKNKK